MPRKPKHPEREEWMGEGHKLLADRLFKPAGHKLPSKVRYSCGFPGGGSSRKRIGECWYPAEDSDGWFNVFVSPVEDDAVEVLGVQCHELCHVIVGSDAGHGPAFRKLALAIGLTGKMTSTVASPELKAKLKRIARELGKYPHQKIDLGQRKKQTTRMLKCECEFCGYTVRVARTWLEYGAPVCPVHREEMDIVPSGGDD